MEGAGYRRVTDDEGRRGMNTDRLGDLVVGVAGDVAGTVMDPRAGLTKLRSMVTGRTLITVAAGLAVGFLLARSRRR